ncbi:MAG: hypothetical protein E1N59_378 [Puniceicoccaceae bacterium 5H]|nr:MAG: hypothetical protein E1N59_378 [Puniceicoccaceae bacterium 5H]
MMRSSRSSRGFTLLEVMVAATILFVLVGCIAVFMLEVTKTYYGAVAKTDYAARVRELSQDIGRDIISANVFVVYPSQADEDHDSEADECSNDVGGRLLVLVHATLNMDDTLPAYDRIDRIIAYAVDTTSPVVDGEGKTIGYPLFRYELEPPATEDWITDVAGYYDNVYTPAGAVNMPTGITEFLDYVDKVLDTTPEYILTVAGENSEADEDGSTFDVSESFLIRRGKTVTLTLGVVASNDNIVDSDGDGKYEAKATSIVTANTLNLSFTPRGTSE